MAGLFTSRGSRRDVSASPPAAQPPHRIALGGSQTYGAATALLHSGTPVVSVMGEVDVATAPALERTLLAVARDGTGEVIVDLTGCSFIDARGLRALASTKMHLDRADRPLALVVSNPSVMRIFEITGFEELFEIYPSLGAAEEDHLDG